MRTHPAAVFVAVAAMGWPGVAPAQRQAPSFHFEAPDGVRIHYLMKGSGPPLVLLHGFALSAGLNWVGPGALDSLATAFTVIVPDLRGHGASGKPHDPAAYGARFVEDVVRLLDHLQVPKAHVAGYSMGGAITLKLATSYPDRVRSAVLGGAGWSAPDSAPPAFLLEWVAKLDRAATERTSVALALQRPEWPPLPQEVRIALDRNDAAALVAVLRGGAGLAVTEADVRALKVPVLAVLGELDVEVRHQVDALVRVRPDVQVSRIPGADHVVAMSHPSLVAAIRAFARAH